jgi:hypothetical protein
VSLDEWAGGVLELRARPSRAAGRERGERAPDGLTGYRVRGADAPGKGRTRMNAIAIILFVVLTVLAGCANTVWTKPGMTLAQFEMDKADCAHTTALAGAVVMQPQVMDTCLRSKGYNPMEE